MQKIIMIGNVTKDVELRTTSTGKDVSSFTVAVNRPKRDGQEQGADYFRVSAWDKQAGLCAKYLKKGSKAYIEGRVSVSTYDGKDGKTHANMDVQLERIEFLSPKNEDGTHMGNMGQTVQADASGMERVDDLGSELPY
jgi:single-strand DNA-binding protein